MTDLREFETKAFDAVSPTMKQEPNAHKRACFRAGWDAAIAALPDMVPDLVFEERRNNYWGHKSHGYQVAWSDGQSWRVRLDGRVICSNIKGHHKAVTWANAHHRAQIMAALGVK